MNPRAKGRKQGARKSASTVCRSEALSGLQDSFQMLSAAPQGEGARLVECVQAAASDALLGHPERDVRLWAAKCLVEGLRIFVPDPPLDAPKLRATMELLIEQLGTLDDPAAPTFVHAVGLAERLVEIRAFMLIFECPDSTELLMQLVQACLRVARSKETKTTLEGSLAQMTSAVLVEEIPKDALILLISELMPQHRSHAFGFVKRVLQSLANRSAALPINDYLNAALQNSGDQTAAKESDLLAVIYELFSIEPALVARVLPNLQADLVSSAVERRRSVTSVVGKLLAHPSNLRMPLLETHPILFDRFAERISDADDRVRLCAVEGVELILGTAACDGSRTYTVGDVPVWQEAARRLRQPLVERCLDPSDAVRLRVVEVAAEAAGSAAGFALVAPALHEIFRRVLDKKPRIREACMRHMALLYAQHALPAWTGGRPEEAMTLSWVPQLFCEAFSVFAGGRLGHTAQLETLLEQHVMGCGASLGAAERAAALEGFCTSALETESSARGFAMLLARKRDANAALCRFVQLRIASSAPIFENAEGAASAEALVRVSPLSEDRPKPEILAGLRALDAVRDRAMWEQLQRVTSATVRMEEMTPQLVELDRLLRVHQVSDIAPVVRRALLCTWILPDHVAVILQTWREGSIESRDASRKVTSELPRYFPGAFLPHASWIVARLVDDVDDVRAALRALAAMGKYCKGAKGAVTCDVDKHTLTGALLQAVIAVVPEIDATGGASFCRKVVRSLNLLSGSEPLEALKQMRRWAEVQVVETEGSSAPLFLAAACIEQNHGVTDETQITDHVSLQAVCCTTLERGPVVAPVACCAAADLFAATGSEQHLASILSGSSENGARLSLQLHTACSTLRAFRCSRVPLTTRLLSRLAAHIDAALSHPCDPSAIDRLLSVLQKFQRSGSASLADRLRLCATLPCVFALAPIKRHRDTAQRMLQASLLKTVRTGRQGTAQQEPLIDFAIACFVHYLSSLDVFASEASAEASAFPESTRISTFFVEALLHCEPSRGMEFAGVALRVADRVKHFVDRENPSSDGVQRSANVLRYTVEKRCPELGVHGAALLRGAARGSMPAALFAIRPDCNARVSLDPVLAQEVAERGTPWSGQSSFRSEGTLEALADVPSLSPSCQVATPRLGLKPRRLSFSAPRAVAMQETPRDCSEAKRSRIA